MKNIDINDIKVSSRLDDVIKSASIERYKEIKNKRRKKVKRSLLVASLGVAMFGAIFSNEISANVKLVMFDVKDYLNINNDLNDYRTVINSSITKNGATVQLNEVILDRDEIIVSTTTKLDEDIKSDRFMTLSGNVYINGKRISSGAGGSSKQIDRYTEETVLAYKLDKELNEGDLEIEIKYDSIYLYDEEKEIKIKGPWEFKFTANGDTLASNSKNIMLNNSFVLENGQIITFNEYTSNDIGQKIYYSIENKDKNNVYDIMLKGYDDLGNDVEFYSSYEEKNRGVMKNQKEISQNANVLTVVPYAVEYPKESGRLSNDYKVVGEKFDIVIN